MQLIKNNLKTLYSFLKKKKTDYYFVSTSDEFLNEYVPDYNMRLKWLTNFSGSNGYALVSEKKNFFFTDGRYLQQANKELPKNFKIFDLNKENLVKFFGSLKNKSVLVDTKCFSKNFIIEISKILENYSEEVKLSFSKTRIKIILGNIQKISKLINASFPDYESVIPKDNNQTMIVDCKSFSETIDRVSTISDDKLRTVKFQIVDNTCTVSSFGNDKSIGTESLAIEYTGSQISINFNARYILDVLSIIKSGKVKFHFSEKTAPTIIESDSFKNSIFLIMQMRA